MISNQRKANGIKNLIEELTLDNYSLKDYIEGRYTETDSVENVCTKNGNLQNSHKEQTDFNVKSYFINSVVFVNIYSETINDFNQLKNINNFKINGLTYDKKSCTHRVYEIYKIDPETRPVETVVSQVPKNDLIFILSENMNKISIELVNRTKINDLKILNKINYIETPHINKLFPGYSVSILSGIKNYLGIRTPSDILYNTNNKETVTTNDILHVFLPNVWLNDEVINFYFDLLVKKSKNKVLAFDSFFFKTVNNSGFNVYLNGVLKNIKIFEYNKIIIPADLSNLKQWVLIVVELQARTITYFDSCVNPSTFEFLSSKISFLVGFLNMVYRAQIGFVPTSTWKIKAGNSPLQKNFNDCGVFVCTNARYAVFNTEINYCQEHNLLLRQRITYEILMKKILPIL